MQDIIDQILKGLTIEDFNWHQETETHYPSISLEFNTKGFDVAIKPDLEHDYSLFDNILYWSITNYNKGPHQYFNEKGIWIKL